jgi:hypothetical protein
VAVQAEEPAYWCGNEKKAVQNGARPELIAHCSQPVNFVVRRQIGK